MFDNDLKIVEKLLARDTESWDNLVRHDAPFLESVTMEAGLDADEARESVQITLASLWEDDAKILREYRGISSLRTYLARIAHRDAMDFLREKKREKRKVERKKNAYIVEGQKVEIAPVEEKLDLEVLLDELDTRSKLLAKLIYYDELTSEEIAAVMGTKASTVDMWRFRLKEKLRKLGDSYKGGESRGDGGK